MATKADLRNEFERAYPKLGAVTRQQIETVTGLRNNDFAYLVRGLTSIGNSRGKKWFVSDIISSWHGMQRYTHYNDEGKLVKHDRTRIA